LIDRDIAKFRHGEQATLITKVAELARNASEELMI
jgi:hypothetical protein